MREIKLELLGLNKYEALAYEALVRLGKTVASEISRESNVPYGRIYDTLNSLASKGLVTVIPEKTKKFAASSPEIIENLINTHIKKAMQLKEEIKKLKKIYTTIEEPIEIAKGKRDFYKIVKKMPRPQNYAYALKATSEVKPDWVRRARENIKSGVDLRVLAYYDQTTNLSIEKWKKLVPKLKQRRFDIKNIAFEIIDNKAVFIALIESNVTLLIKDIQFTKLMKRFYETIWEKAEKI